MSGRPEAITRDELAGVLKDCAGDSGSIVFMGSPERVAAELVAEVLAHREPEYEPGGAYADARGDNYLRSSTGGWVDYSTTWHPHAFPLRPLRRLVPGGRTAPADEDGPQEVVQPGEMYEDKIGQRFYRMSSDDGWLMLPEGIWFGDNGSHPAYPLTRLVPEGSPLADSERDLIRRDLGQLLELLGLGDFARPASSHEVFVMCLEAVAKLTGKREETCPGGC